MRCNLENKREEETNETVREKKIAGLQAHVEELREEGGEILLHRPADAADGLLDEGLLRVVCVHFPFLCLVARRAERQN